MTTLHSSHFSKKQDCWIILTLQLLISWATINSTVQTSLLGDIAHYYHVSTNHVTMFFTIFLIGYALSQLIFGFFVDFLKRKSAIFISGLTICLGYGFMGISIVNHDFSWMIFARFIIGLGSSGLMMSFLLMQEIYKDPHKIQVRTPLMLLSFVFFPFAWMVILSYIDFLYNDWLFSYWFLLAYNISVFLLFLFTLPETNPHPHSFIDMKKTIIAYKEVCMHPCILMCAIGYGLVISLEFSFFSIGSLVISPLHWDSLHYSIVAFICVSFFILGSLLASKVLPKKSENFNLFFYTSVIILLCLVFIMLHYLHWVTLIDYFIFIAFVFFFVSFSMAVISTIVFRYHWAKPTTSSVTQTINLTINFLLGLSFRFIPVNMINHIYFVLVVAIIYTLLMIVFKLLLNKRYPSLY